MDSPNSAPLLVDHLEEGDLSQPGSILYKVMVDIKELYKIALPLIFTGLLVYGKSLISMLFMGRLGKDVLAGGALAIAIANITGYSVISGLSMGMEGISSQAFGAKQWSIMGQSLQRTILILLLVSIPISILWLNIQPLLVFSGQDPYVSSFTSTYLAFCIPDLVFKSLIHPIKIYLRSQSITMPLMASSAISLALHAPINYLLVRYFHLGIKGIALAVVIADFNLVASLMLYLSFSKVHWRLWRGWSTQCFREWKPILSLALPSCITVCLEWWWYELMILLSGFLGNATAAVATMGLLIQATSLIYIFPSSLSMAASTRVGNELGANQPHNAKACSYVALGCGIVTSLAAMSFMFGLRSFWGHFFTEDMVILALTGAVMPVVGLCELGNCPQTTGCGVLRGSARPTLGARINLGSFYGLGLPLAIFLGFGAKLGLLGLWLGLLAAQALCTVLMVVVLARTDWVLQAQRARQLIHQQVEVEYVNEDGEAAI